jgi:hypothetical protein
MKTVDETIRAIREIAEQIGFIGQNWARLMDALNEAGVTSRRGQPWNHIQAVQQWCARNGVFARDELQPVSEMLAGPTQHDQAEQLELVAGEMHVAMQDVEDEVSQAIEEQGELPEPARGALQVPPLSPDEMAALREMLAAWKSRQVVPVSTPEQVPSYRPSFPGPRNNTGIRVNRRLLRAALEKAKNEDAALTGGGKLSPLIEHLLWGYLNYDPKFLKP